MDQQFNPDTFMNAVFSDANDTRLLPCPVGEYQATIEKVEPKSGVSAKNGLPWARLDITWDVQDFGVKQALSREKVSVRQGLMLDLTDSGGIDMGKGRNINLGRLREAVGLNTPGQAFSPNMLVGRSAKISVKHEIYQDNPQANVAGVTKL